LKFPRSPSCTNKGSLGFFTPGISWRGRQQFYGCHGFAGKAGSAQLFCNCAGFSIFPPKSRRLQKQVCATRFVPAAGRSSSGFITTRLNIVILETQYDFYLAGLSRQVHPLPDRVKILPSLAINLI